MKKWRKKGVIKRPLGKILAKYVDGIWVHNLYPNNNHKSKKSNIQNNNFSKDMSEKWRPQLSNVHCLRRLIMLAFQGRGIACLGYNDFAREATMKTCDGSLIKKFFWQKPAAGNMQNTAITRNFEDVPGKIDRESFQKKTKTLAIPDTQRNVQGA